MPSPVPPSPEPQDARGTASPAKRWFVTGAVVAALIGAFRWGKTLLHVPFKFVVDDVARAGMAGGRALEHAPFGSTLDDLARASTRAGAAEHPPIRLLFGDGGNVIHNLSGTLRSSATTETALTSAIDDVATTVAGGASWEGQGLARVEQLLHERLARAGAKLDPVTGQTWWYSATAPRCLVDVPALARSIVAAGASAKLTYDLIVKKQADGTVVYELHTTATAVEPDAVARATLTHAVDRAVWQSPGAPNDVPAVEAFATERSMREALCRALADAPDVELDPIRGLATLRFSPATVYLVRVAMLARSLIAIGPQVKLHYTFVPEKQSNAVTAWVLHAEAAKPALETR